MPRRPGRGAPRAVHVEVFLTRREDRRKVVSVCGKLYRTVRRFTERQGGWGPRLYLLESHPRRGPGPVEFRKGVRARSSEDLWIEIAFYPSSSTRRSIVRHLWTNERVRATLVQAESYNLARRGSWLLGVGEFRA
jgi:hypothetical protein